MAGDFIKLTKLTIYVGEDFFYKDKPFFKAIFDVCTKYKIAGCTVLRATQGYGSRIRGKERRLMISVSDSINLPVIITIIDTKEQIELLYPFLEENLTHGAATVEEVDMLATKFIKEQYEKKITNRNNPVNRE